MMRAQFALFELMLSLTMLISAVSIGGALVYTSPLTSGSYNFNYPNLEYDLPRLLYSGGFSSCLIESNHACIASQVNDIRSVYGLSYIRLNGSSINVSSGSDSYCGRYQEECLPAPSNPGVAVCAYWCG